MNDRDRLWSAASALIEGLGPRFGIFKGQALRIAYDNIYTKLRDDEIAMVLANIRKAVA